MLARARSYASTTRQRSGSANEPVHVVVYRHDVRTIFIGDLHGCREEAEELLDACKATADDWVIFLGDLVDRGPDSAGCVDLAMRVEARQGRPACIEGNHEEKHLDYETVVARLGHEPTQMPNTHRATREQLRPEHYAYMRRLPLFLRVLEHGAVAVHAGCFPGRPIEEQTPRHLLHIQSIQPPVEKSVWPSRVPVGEESKWTFWTRLWDGPERVVFGHSVLDRPLITDRVVGIDGGACFGRELWAYVLPGGELVRVKGKQLHDAADAGRRGNPHLRPIKVHGEVGTF